MAYNVGGVVTLDGIESVIIYDAGEESVIASIVVSDLQAQIAGIDNEE